MKAQQDMLKNKTENLRKTLRPLRDTSIEIQSEKNKTLLVSN